MGVILTRSLILYVLVIFAVRLMGKRQLGELQPSELVITILVSNIATLPLEDVNIPVIVGITPILALVCFEVVVSWLNLKSETISPTIDTWLFSKILSAMNFFSLPLITGIDR